MNETNATNTINETNAINKIDVKINLKKAIKRVSTTLLSVLLCAALLLQLPGVASAFTPDVKWNFMQLAVINTGETLSESNSYNATDDLSRAYNPGTERAALSFAVEHTQPYAVEVWTRTSFGSLYGGANPTDGGTLVGYLQGEFENVTYTFSDTTAQYFHGYDGLLQELIDNSAADPYPGTDTTNFINTIEWDGGVIGTDSQPVTLANNTEYIVVLQPLTVSEENNRAYLAVKIDRALPPTGIGAPVGAGSPFDAFAALAGTHNISMLSGNYVHSNIDLAVAGAQPLAFTRTYNSTDDYVGILGANWRTNWDYSLVESNLSARVNMPDGTYYDFALNYDGSYTAPEASDLILVKSGGAFTMTDRQKSVYEFSSGGKIEKITALGGFVTTFGYSGGKLETITSVNNSATLTQILTLEYTNNLVTKVSTSPGNRLVTYTYDGGNLASFTNAEGNTSAYTYDNNHRLKSFTENSGAGNERVALELDYDAYGRVTSATINGAATPCTLSYDLATRTTTAADSAGRQYSYIYDRDRNVTTIVKPVSDSSTSTTTLVYSGGRVISETVVSAEYPGGSVTSYTFDAAGNMTSVTRHDGSGSLIEYNALNLPTKVETFKTESDGITITIVGTATYAYDARGNITSATDKNSSTTTYVYDADNNCVSSTNSKGETTTFEYDEAGRLTKVTTPDGGSVAREYDAQGKLTSEVTAMGSKTEYVYDGNGYLIEKIDALGNSTTYEVDANGRTTKMTDALGNVTLYTYDTAGNVLTQTDPLLRVTTYSYDTMNHLLSEAKPEARGVSYSYDADGRVTGMTDARSNTWTYDYNSDGRQTGLTDPIGNKLVGVYDS